MKKILYYRSDETIYMCLYNFCISHNIVLQRVDDSLLNIKLKDVFALQEEHNGKCEAFPDSYLLLDEISNEELVNLLRNLKENGCPFEGIKVTRTANNHIANNRRKLPGTCSCREDGTSGARCPCFLYQRLPGNEPSPHRGKGC